MGCSGSASFISGNAIKQSPPIVAGAICQPIFALRNSIVGIPTILTSENAAIVEANARGRRCGGIMLINRLLPTPIVVPPTRPARKRQNNNPSNRVVVSVIIVNPPNRAILQSKKRRGLTLPTHRQTLTPAMTEASV